MTDDLTRPIIRIENRTAQEAFDIMCDRIEQERLARKSPSPQPHTGRAGEQDGRTSSGETVLGMPVTAYMEETELGGKFATHWSTIPEHRNPVKLFAEADVRAALNAAEPEAGEVPDSIDPAGVLREDGT